MVSLKDKIQNNPASFTVKELLKATNGRLLQGSFKGRVLGVSTDTRTLRPGELFVAIKGNNLNGHDFIAAAVRKSAGGLIISERRGFVFAKNLPVILVKDTTRAFGGIACFHRKRFDIPVIAITGSNGKTTVKEMTAAVLQQRFIALKSEGTQNNHIGVPRTLLKLNAKHQAAILEFGTNHPGEISYLASVALPTAAIITNIGPSHLEFFKTLNGVLKEKKSLLKGLQGPRLAILNNDDPFLRQIRNRDLRVVTFGINQKSRFMAGDILRDEDRLSFLVNGRYKIGLNTPARHSIYNALGAIACARSLGVDFNSIKKALAKFKFPDGRLQIRRFKGIKIIDDTYNANPLSLKCAVDVLTGYNSHRKIAVCADMKELGDKSNDLHLSLGKYIGQSSIDLLITVGKLARYISAGAKKAGMQKDRVCHVNSIQQAARRLARIIRPQDIVLVKGSRSMAMEKVITGLGKG
ncbi:MAG: UDP-N-acetylmuramoyl-tripeptide--D-alanyl-D-alanine ligase [Candidatus Omnitrophota bacterium]|nr:UDP-N-acetylmuramoyl-tripeptide--D-alanyl-D-alanine ligase [Candidatus Omnitrophota bacterium]